MARILIFGGHGKVAMPAASLLIERGDSVSSVIRDPDHADDVRAAGAEPVVDDIEALDTDGLTELIRGHDAVVWSAGAGGGNPARTYAVDRDAAIRSVDAAAAAGVRRYVMVSYSGARRDHGVAEESSFFPYAEAKAAADEHLRAAGLDETVLGPGRLTQDAPIGRIEIDPDGDGAVSRADVANAIAAALVDETTIGRTIRFGAGSTPIAEAIRG